MAIGPKTKRFLAARQNPGASVFNFLNDLQSMADELAQNAVAKAIETLRTSLDADVKAAYAEAHRLIGNLPEELSMQVKNMMEQRINAIPHLKGDPGYTPKKGVDYHDGAKGDAGTSLVAGKDYPTIAQIEQSMREYAAQYTRDLEERGLTREQIIDELKNNELDPAAIARSLETLKDAERLDYFALKNRPGIDVAEEAGKAGRHTLHRGGTSKQTYYYDLSALCDGNTKVFTVPANTRIVSAHCTDAPAGVLRPQVDWTGSGSVVFTLTNQVVAPSQGATLYILYVV